MPPHRKVPRRFKGDVKSIHTREMAPEEALQRRMSGKTIPRGTIIAPFPEMPAVSVDRLNLVFRTDGAVRGPSYIENAAGELERGKDWVARNPSAAMRKAWRSRVSVEANEAPFLDLTYRQIQGLHDAIYEKWFHMNARQRKSVQEYAKALEGTLTPRRGVTILRDPHKKKAIGRLNSAAELLREGNAPAALTSLTGAAYDLIARKNILNRQAPLLERRRKSIEREKFQDDRQVYTFIDRLIGMDRTIAEHYGRGKKVPPLSAAIRRGQARTLQRIAREARQRKEPVFKAISARVSRAARLIRDGKVKNAVPLVRMVRRDLVDFASKDSMLFGERLQWVANHRNAELKQRILRNQLIHSADNLEYWAAHSSSELGNLPGHLESLQQVSNTSKIKEQMLVTAEIQKARSALRQTHHTDCRGHLKRAVQLIEGAVI